MKVKIGNYKDHWVGPYQIAGMLKYIGVSPDTCYDIGERLDKTPLKKICNFIYNINPFKHQTVKIHIDPWDTWNMDTTLALIILPMLKQLRDTKHGSPVVEDEDVPESIKSTNAKPKKNEFDTDEFFFARWDYVLEEMIWAFEQIPTDWESAYHTKTEFNSEGYNKHLARIKNGTRLFGVYYLGLWD